MLLFKLHLIVIGNRKNYGSVAPIAYMRLFSFTLFTRNKFQLLTNGTELYTLVEILI